MQPAGATVRVLQVRRQVAEDGREAVQHLP